MNLKEERISSLIRQNRLHEARSLITDVNMSESIPGFCNYHLAIIYNKLRNKQAARYYLNLVQGSDFPIDELREKL